MKPFQLCGLGNSLVDIFIDLNDDDFASLSINRGGMVLVTPEEQTGLLERFHDEDPRLVSGGSVANSTIAFAQLGGKSAFIGCVGDDRYGLFYQQEFEQLGIDIGNPAIVNETTGTCVCLITPDAERTMRTALAVSSHLSAEHVDEARIKQSEWLFIEGYVFANPETGQGAIRRALEIAKANDVKVALTCSDGFIPEVFGNVFNEALQQADLLFCNAGEAMALTQTTNVQDAFAKLKELVPASVLTDGPHGAYVRYNGEECHVPAFECEPIDLTGAGDMFAGAFLYGIVNGTPAETSARAACYLSMKVITQVGARLHHGTREAWDHALNQA